MEAQPIQTAPALLLESLLGVARDPKSTHRARIDAYRRLLQALTGRLADRRLALALHRQWIDFSLEAPMGGIRIYRSADFQPSRPRWERTIGVASYTVPGSGSCMSGEMPKS